MYVGSSNEDLSFTFFFIEYDEIREFFFFDYPAIVRPNLSEDFGSFVGLLALMGSCIFDVIFQQSNKATISTWMGIPPTGIESDPTM
ncbi:MAG: hypothetical protein CM1200mP39_08170 [Dehalococcoidia bacterium]|nr:MAG: hypothetical protein CM1200mP39_08170 [Dehalococcoidia bacterium]